MLSFLFRTGLGVSQKLQLLSDDAPASRGCYKLVPEFINIVIETDKSCSANLAETLSGLRMVKWKSPSPELNDWGCLQKLFKACKVTEIDMSSCHVKSSSEFYEPHSLQKLILRNCTHMTSLPKSLGKLRCLKILDVSHSANLEHLPSTIDGLRCLENINFSCCRNLKDIPENIGLLSFVKEIDLSYCKSIEKLPKSLVKLSTLRVLNLRACTHLSELPQGSESLDLERLCLESCKRLNGLPEIFGKETSVENTVSLSRCFGLPELSNGFINLIKAKVEHLILVDCIKLTCLPEEFHREIGRLKTINLSGCINLQRLPKQFHKLQYLEKINLRSCENLEESSIRRLKHLPALKEVNLSNCKSVEGKCLNSLSKIATLTFVDIHDSPNLVDRWEQMRIEETPINFTATTGSPIAGSHSCLPITNDSLAQKGFAKKTFEFFNDKWYFVDATGRPFYPSTLNEDTTLAVLFNIPYEKEELQGLETILDALLTTSNFLKIVHVGYFVNAFAKLAIRHCVYTSDDYEAKLFFENILAEVESFEEKGSSAMIVCEVKTSEVGKKGFSRWRSISNESLKAMTSNVPKSEFLRWKQLIHTPSEINIEVLRKMLFTKEKEMKINSLLISCPGDTEKHELERLMNEVKDKNQLGWVPIISFGRGTRAIQNQEVGSLTWASVVDPGRINPIAMHVFRVYYVLKKLPLIIKLSCHGKDG